LVLPVKIKAAWASHPSRVCWCDVRICLIAAPGSELHFRNRAPEGALRSSCICEPKFTVAAFDWWSDPAGLGLIP